MSSGDVVTVAAEALDDVTATTVGLG